MSNVLLYALNLIDLTCTLIVFRIGATELNPLMRSVPVLVVYKLVVVGWLVAWLSRRREPMAQIGVRICTAVYAGLDCYHLVCLILIGGMIC